MHFTNLFITVISALVCVRFPVLTERKHTNNRWQIHVFEFVQLGLLFIFVQIKLLCTWKENIEKSISKVKQCACQ